MKQKILFIFLCFLISLNFASMISNCPDSSISTFKSLKFVSPENIENCNWTLGVNSWMDFDTDRTGKDPYFYWVSSGGGYYNLLPKLAGPTSTRINLFNIDYENFNITFPGYKPETINSEFDSIFPYGGTQYYFSYYNSTHLIYNSSGGTRYLIYNNGTHNSSYIQITEYDSSVYNLQIANLDNEDFLFNSGEVNSTFPTPHSKDNTIPLSTPSANIYKFWKYYTVANQDKTQGYIMGYADPLRNYIVESDSNFDIENFEPEGNLCGAYFIGNNDLLLPELSYTPYTSFSDHGRGFVMSNWYSNDFYVSYVWNGSATFIKDKTYGYWWFVPSFECTSLTEPITLNIIQLPPSEYEGDLTSRWILPVIPNQKTCINDGVNYTVNAKTNNNEFHYITVHWINGTNSTITTLNQQTTKTYSYTFPLSDYTNISRISYYINTAEQCRYTTETSILGINALDIPSGFEWLTNIIMVVIVGVSIFMPYFIFFGIVWNDLFLIMSPTLMGAMVILIGFTSAIVQYTSKGTSFSMKTFTFFAIFGFLFILFAMTQTGAEINPEDFEAFSDLAEQYETFSNVLSNPTPADLLITSFTFLLSLISFFLFAPAHFVNFTIAVLFEISPPIAQGLSFFAPILIIGIYAVILAKGYELLSNRYLEV